MYQGSAHRPPVRDHTAVLLAIERLDRGVASENPLPFPPWVRCHRTLSAIAA